MKSIMGMYSWLSIATSGIRFGPDQEAVRDELREHIEDKAADLMRIFPDIPEEEAGQRALAAMGDAWELKKELARVHSPWLGYLWRLTQVLVWGLLALSLIAALGSGASLLEGQAYRWEEARKARAVGRALYEDGTPDWEGERLAVYEVDETARLGRAVISVSRAARWQEPEGDCLYLRLRITWDRPWEVNPMTVSCLFAEDDLGNTYEINTARAFREGWNWYQLDLALEGVPLSARELRVHHELRDGLDLAVDLTREVVP